MEANESVVIIWLSDGKFKSIQCRKIALYKCLSSYISLTQPGLSSNAEYRKEVMGVTRMLEKEFDDE